MLTSDSRPRSLTAEAQLQARTSGRGDVEQDFASSEPCAVTPPLTRSYVKSNGKNPTNCLIRLRLIVVHLKAMEINEVCAAA